MVNMGDFSQSEASPSPHEVRVLEEDEAVRIGNVLLTLRRAFMAQAKMITDCTSSIDIDLGED